jgi:hypothetical protein
MRRLIALLSLLAGYGCGTITPSMKYDSRLAAGPVDLKVDVRVLVARDALPSAFHADEEFRESITNSFRTSIIRDVSANGPFKIDDRAPDATLDVELTWLHEYHDAGVAAPGFLLSIFYSSVPPFLGWVIWPAFGTPTARHDLDAKATARVVAKDGTVLAELASHAECSAYTGWYYDEVTFECVARTLMETIRSKLARTVPKALATKPGPTRRTSQVIAVMPSQSSGKSRFEGESLDAFTDQLRVYIAQQGARVIDRGRQEAALKDVVDGEKSKSYAPCVDASCQIPLGKALAATHILRSTVAGFGNTCATSAELIDLRSEVTVSAGSAEGDCSEEALLDAARKLAGQLFKGDTTSASRP